MLFLIQNTAFLPAATHNAVCKLDISYRKNILQKSVASNNTGIIVYIINLKYIRNTLRHQQITVPVFWHMVINSRDSMCKKSFKNRLI